MITNLIAQRIAQQLPQMTQRRDETRRSLSLREIIERPYEAIFSEPSSFSPEQRYAYSRPVFQPSVRRSPRRRQRPLSTGPVTYRPSEGLICSLKTVWDFYGDTNLADNSLLDVPFGETGTIAFLTPLDKHFTQKGVYYDWLDHHVCGDDLMRTVGLHIELPFIHCDDEDSEFWTGLLFCPESFGGVLAAVLEEHPDFDDASRHLVDTVGLPKIAKVYAQSQMSDKILDLKKFQTYPGYYQAVEDEFPEYMDMYQPVTIGDTPTDVDFEHKGHLHFALKFIECFNQMMASAPSPWRVYENDENYTHDLVADMCRVYLAEQQSGNIENLLKSSEEEQGEDREYDQSEAA